MERSDQNPKYWTKLCITHAALEAVFKARNDYRDKVARYVELGKLIQNQYCAVSHDEEFALSFTTECWRAFLEPKFLVNRLSILGFISPFKTDLTQFHFIYSVVVDKRLGKGNGLVITSPQTFSGYGVDAREGGILNMSIKSIRSMDAGRIEDIESVMAEFVPSGQVEAHLSPDSVPIVTLSTPFSRPDIVCMLPVLAYVVDSSSNSPIERIELTYS